MINLLFSNVTRQKICFGLLFCFIIQITASAQEITYKEIDFSDALKEAKKSKELVFIQITSDCEECNTVANRGLSGNEIIDIFKNFISIKVHPGTDDYEEITQRFRLSLNYPTSIFLNTDGYFLNMMYNKSTSNSREYIKLAAQAMANKKNPPLASFTDKYGAGKYSPEFLRGYITELSKYNLNTADLLEEYVRSLTVDQLFTINEIKFLIHSAPLIDSKPYKLMRFEKELYDSVFWSFSNKERIQINQKIIRKSKEKAFDEKDSKYMSQVANYIQGTYSDRKKGRKYRDLNMLRFYKEVKDTSQYIHTAKWYYQSNFQNLDIDSISIVEKNKFTKTENGGIIKSSKSLYTGNQINELAWTIYEFSDDPEVLGLILKWAESILVYENPAYHDTYAHILYKIGAKEKAIQWQQKAIDLSNAAHRPSENLVKELEKMINDNF